MTEVLDFTQSKEMFVLCPFWEIVGPHGMHAGLDGRPNEDHGHNQFGGAEECEIVVCNVEAYGILYEIHQEICLDHHVDGKVVKEGCHILLE